MRMGLRHTSCVSYVCGDSAMEVTEMASKKAKGLTMGAYSDARLAAMDRLAACVKPTTVSLSLRPRR
jgi:hypothetical protein